MTNFIASHLSVGALLPLVTTALILTLTLTVRLRRRGRVRGVSARARLLARASLSGALRRLLGETHVVLSRDALKTREEGEGSAFPVFQEFDEAFTAADGFDLLLIRKRDLAPVCAVALENASETPLSVPSLKVPVVTLPLKRAYALQDVDAALSPVLNAPPALKPEPNPEAEAGDAEAPPSAHSPQRDAPRLPSALPTS